MELSEWFLNGLKECDSSLSAVYDNFDDCIHLHYSKSGRKSLAYSVKRSFGELYPELQRRILKELPIHDIWRRFGSGKAYDDYLYEEDKRRRETAQKKIDDERWEKIKAAKWQIRSAVENARSGRLTEREAKKIEIPTMSVPINIPKEGESE